MEWDEFTRFVVVKAQLHHAQMSIDQLAEYRQGPRQVNEQLKTAHLRRNLPAQVGWVPFDLAVWRVL